MLLPISVWVALIGGAIICVTYAYLSTLKVMPDDERKEFINRHKLATLKVNGANTSGVLSVEDTQELAAITASLVPISKHSAYYGYGVPVRGTNG